MDKCQVQIMSKGRKGKETLCHYKCKHPKEMLALFAKVYKHVRPAKKRTEPLDFRYEWRYKLMPGKVAELLLWADPDFFEPQRSHKLHWNINRLFRLYLVDVAWQPPHHLGKPPVWEVEIYEPAAGFQNDSKMGRLNLVVPRTPLPNLMKRYRVPMPNAVEGKIERQKSWQGKRKIATGNIK